MRARRASAGPGSSFFVLPGGGDEERVRELFAAQVHYQQHRRDRQAATTALALGSILPWLAMAPALHGWRSLAFLGWCTLALLTLACALLEARWLRALVRMAEELEARREPS